MVPRPTPRREKARRSRLPDRRAVKVHDVESRRPRPAAVRASCAKRHGPCGGQTGGARRCETAPRARANKARSRRTSLTPGYEPSSFTREHTREIEDERMIRSGGREGAYLGRKGCESWETLRRRSPQDVRQNTAEGPVRQGYRKGFLENQRAPPVGPFDPRSGGPRPGGGPAGALARHGHGGHCDDQVNEHS